MRRTVALRVDVDIVVHEGGMIDDERLAVEFGAMVAQTTPRVLAIGETSVMVPDGAGGFIKKPAVVVSLRTMEASVVPLPVTLVAP